MNGSGILGGITKIFTGLYNTLFEVESGEILRAIEHIETNSPLGNATLLSGDKEILNTLTGTPQDFIISWDGINYQNQEIIPSRID